MVAAVQERAFRTLMDDGFFSVRDYAAMVVAQITVLPGRRALANGMRALAAYMSGANDGYRPDGTWTKPPWRKAGTALARIGPVRQIVRPDRNVWTIQFTLSPAHAFDSLPWPHNPAIALRRRPPERCAILRFCGPGDDKAYTAKAAALSTWIEAQGLKSRGEAVLARYDAPWTPWLLRRYDISLRLRARPLQLILNTSLPLEKRTLRGLKENKTPGIL